MANESSADKFRLQIDAHALLQLGDQLITDEEQALLELAKNSYDADAEYAKIRIVTDYVPVPSDPAPQDAIGLIEIEDNGTGMGEQELRRGWLTISLSLKRTQKERGRPSPKFGRFPLGDKGLGRLGTMKLGRYLSVETRRAPTEDGWRLTFHWYDIKSGEPLENVEIKAVRVSANGQTGTTVRIFGLHDRQGWTKAKRQVRLAQKLAGLLSPFTPADYFDVSFSINGASIVFPRISTRLRDTATVSIDYRWNNQTLEVHGGIKMIWFRKKRVEAYNEHIEGDRGRALAAWLRVHKRNLEPFHWHIPPDGPWLIRFSKTYQAAELFNPHVEDADPGPFHGAIDYFDLDTDIEAPDFMSDAGEYRKLVKDLSGVYVYRDGFGIRMHRDWLDLGAGWTSQRGFYSLKPRNVIGYFQLSVVGNPDLVEKSDREGFMATPAALGFERLAHLIAHDVANYVLNEIGKGSASFLKERLGEHASDDEPEYGELLSRLEKLLASAVQLNRDIKESTQPRREALRAAEGAIRIISNDRKLPDDVRERAKKFLKVVEDGQTLLGNADDAALQFSQQMIDERPLAGHLRKRFDTFQEQTQELFQLVAVGLSAQALAHDAPGLLSNAEEHLRALEKSAVGRIVDQAEIRLKATRVAEGLDGIRQMLALVDPMLRGKRATRRKAKVSEFVKTFFDQRGPRLKAHGVTWGVDPDSVDFEIAFNPGRFVQIMDNLATNSEYWTEYMFGKSQGKGRITIEIENPYLVFFDNGPGVHPDMENLLFEIFQSGKPQREGSGLGLFITQQLLLRESCSIRLDDELNQNGRRFRFVIDLSGARTSKS